MPACPPGPSLYPVTQVIGAPSECERQLPGLERPDEHGRLRARHAPRRADDQELPPHLRLTTGSSTFASPKLPCFVRGYFDLSRASGKAFVITCGVGPCPRGSRLARGRTPQGG